MVMPNDIDNKVNRGLSLSTILVVIFTVLKLTGLIDWSWWWVISPWIISLVTAMLILMGFLILILILDSKSKK